MVFRRRGGRRSYSRPVIQSYKNITVDGPASRAAATNIIHIFALGVDDYSGPTVAGSEVPTGAEIRYMDIQPSFMNLVLIAGIISVTIQKLRSGQTAINPLAQFGNPQRNQVFYTRTFMIGQNQNNNLHIPFKVPKGMQRMREGDRWELVYRSDIVFTSITQAIYKFYR